MPPPMPWRAFSGLASQLDGYSRVLPAAAFRLAKRLLQIAEGSAEPAAP